LDDQLKQRLWGATIIVALAVIFVPMLFDKPGEDLAGISDSSVPPLPPEAREREIALPAMPDEAAKTEPAAGEAQPRERPAYRIIPLDDNPPPKQEGKPLAEEPQDTPAQAGSPTEFDADEGGLPDELPTRDSPLAKLPRAGGKAKDAPTPRSDVAAPKAVLPGAGAPPQREPPGTERPATTKPATPAKGPARQPLTMETKPPPAVQASPPKSAPLRKDASGDAASAKATKPDAKARAEDSKASAKAPAPTPVKQPARESAELARPARPESTREKPTESAADAPAKKKPETVASAGPATASSAKPSSSSSAKPVPDGKSPATPASKAKSAPSPSSWVVRAATYNSEASAKALAEKLKKQQFPAYIQKVTGERGTVYRVQVGPASDKARAEQTRKRLESSAGVRGTLVAR
jgi:DedD protein